MKIVSIGALAAVNFAILSGCAPTTKTPLAVRFATAWEIPGPIKRLNGQEKEPGPLCMRSANLPRKFDAVWAAVLDVLRAQGERVVEAEESTGIIASELTIHSELWLPHHDKYYFVIEELEPGLTQLTYRYFRYLPRLNPRNGQVFLVPETQDRELRKGCEAFEQRLAGRLY